MKFPNNRENDRSMKLALITATTTFAIILGGCATPTVVERERPEDYRLACEQLEREMREAEDFRKKAEKEKGVTGTNVAAAIFFWPAMVGTYQNASEAINAANERKRHLMDIYNGRGCHGK